MMMFLAPVKMTATRRTWIKISMMIVRMTVTLTDQMEKVKGMNLCTVMIMKEKTMKKKNQVRVDESSMIPLINSTQAKSPELLMHL